MGWNFEYPGLIIDCFGYVILFHSILFYFILLPDVNINIHLLMSGESADICML